MYNNAIFENKVIIVATLCNIIEKNVVFRINIQFVIDVAGQKT